MATTGARPGSIDGVENPAAAVALRSEGKNFQVAAPTGARSVNADWGVAAQREPPDRAGEAHRTL